MDGSRAEVSRETWDRRRAVFGDRLELARAYADLLVGPGVTRGLIGPREAGRVWERHLLNCAVVADVLPAAGRLADVGSGAGLPGLVLAMLRPGLDVTLVESLQRRTDFLDEAVAALGLRNVTVCRDRAENLAGRRTFDLVTARAVAPLDRLAGWCLPLLRPGSLLALKGARAAAEVAAAEPTLRRHGATGWSVLEVGASLLEQPTTVVRVDVGRPGSGGWPHGVAPALEAPDRRGSSPGGIG